MFLFGGIYYEKFNIVNVFKFVFYFEEFLVFCYICLDMEEVVWDICLLDVFK